MSNNTFLVPEVVLNIIKQYDPNNKLTNESEKFQAEGRLRAIIQACENGLAVKKTPRK